MKKLKILLTTAFLLLGFSCTKLVANPVDYNNAVGFYCLGGEGINNYGVYGMQYQHWFNNVVGISAEGMVSYLKDSYQPFFANVNVEADFQLFKAKVGEYAATRLYAFVEGGYHAYSEASLWDSTSQSYTNIKIYNNLLMAVGLTFEYDFFEHISIPIKFGIGGELPNNFSAGMIVGTGIRFLF